MKYYPDKAKEFCQVKGVPPDGEPDEWRETWKFELDASPLARAMAARLAELGGDLRGDALLEKLIAHERAGKPLQDDATDWLDEVGDPTPEPWDEFDFTKDNPWWEARW